MVLVLGIGDWVLFVSWLLYLGYFSFMSSFHLQIATLERVVFDGEVISVTLPGEAGEFGVLARHAPLITPLKTGEITARKDGETFYMAISGGLAEVQPQRVLVLADQAERAEEIDEELAEEGRRRAEELMREQREDAGAFEAARIELERALLRIKIARKHKSKRSG